MITAQDMVQMMVLGFGVSLVLTLPIYVVGAAFHIFKGPASL